VEPKVGVVDPINPVEEVGVEPKAVLGVVLVPNPNEGVVEVFG